MASAFAAVVILAAPTTLLRSHAPPADHPAGSAGMMSLQDFQTSADVSKLPIEHFEDRSRVFSKAAR
jgi:hypothetical protein